MTKIIATTNHQVSTTNHQQRLGLEWSVWNCMWVQFATFVCAMLPTSWNYNILQYDRTMLFNTPKWQNMAKLAQQVKWAIDKFLLRSKLRESHFLFFCFSYTTKRSTHQPQNPQHLFVCLLTSASIEETYTYA